MWSGWLGRRSADPTAGWSSGPGLKRRRLKESERLGEAQRAVKVPSGVSAAGRGRRQQQQLRRLRLTSTSECPVSQYKELQGPRCHSAGGL